MGLAGIPRFLGIKSRARVGKHQSYGVTTLGKEKAENFDLSGPRWKVLAHLAEEGPSSMSEIMHETNLSDEKVKLILRGLIADGYVISVSQGD